MDNNERWSGSFTSVLVEEIAHKAGSFKKFDVFVRMLVSAFMKESTCVFVELLTYTDLEQMKARKVGRTGSSTASVSVVYKVVLISNLHKR